LTFALEYAAETPAPGEKPFFFSEVRDGGVIAHVVEF
jgi:hypothetical protein